jgi:hypothetical protein
VPHPFAGLFPRHAVEQFNPLASQTHTLNIGHGQKASSGHRGLRSCAPIQPA